MSELEVYDGMVSETESPPHLLFTDNKLIHPIQDSVYELQKYPDTTLNAHLYAAKEDWLLFSSQHGSTIFKAFFFNPFTQETVWLQDLLGPPMSMCFTSPPTCQDWKVVVVRRSYSKTSRKVSIVIDTIQCREDQWTTCAFEFRDKSSFEFSDCNPVLYKGLFYLFDKNAKILVHNPMKNTFFLKEAPGYVNQFDGEHYMLESDGELLAVFVGAGGSSVLVCHWNLTKMIWEKWRSSQNKALFLSRPYSMCEIVNATGMRSRIYFPRLAGESCLFYSLETKKFHTSDGSCFINYYRSTTNSSSTWIKPCHD